MLGLWVLVSLVSLVWTPHTLLETDGFHAWASPSAAHPLGTDGVGADVLSWLMAGSRTNLAIEVQAVLIVFEGLAPLGSRSAPLLQLFFSAEAAVGVAALYELLRKGQIHAFSFALYIGAIFAANVGAFVPPQGKARSASRRCVKFSENRKFENTRKQEHLREFKSKHSIN